MKNGLMWRKYVQWWGVVLQHVRGYIYTNDNIFYSLWWVVALFIMIGGYNAMVSFAKRGKVLVKKRIWGILIPYFFATILYTLYDNRFLNATEVLVRLLHFDATGPLYYVAVYVCKYRRSSAHCTIKECICSGEQSTTTKRVSYAQKLRQCHGLWRHKCPIDTAFEI